MSQVAFKERSVDCRDPQAADAAGLRPLAFLPGRRACRTWFALGLLAATAAAAVAAELPAASPRDDSNSATEERLKRDVEYLSSDELEGRGLKTKGLDLAAEFIAREFQAAGLRSDLYQGTPYHEFRLYSAARSGAVQSLRMEIEGSEAQTLAPGDDFTSLMVTTGKAFRLPVVFAGYGITDPESGYDDYAGVDVRGKAVIVLRHAPFQGPAGRNHSAREAGHHAYIHTKLRNAQAHGAAAVLLCTDQRHLTGATSAQGAAVDPLLEVELSAELGLKPLPVVHCRRSWISRWIQQVLGKNLEELEQRIDATQGPASSELPGAKVAGEVAVVRPGRTVRNVVGVLEGQGATADETIIIGAHYDHLGRGGWGSLALSDKDEIHNGADDNASGTAVLLELARSLARRERRRRILFIAFAAEELGLYGSKRYVQDPLIPLDQTVAMLNLDMVGRLREDRLTVYGTGTAQEWPLWLAQAASASALRIVPEPSGFGPSDHAPFYERGIPVLHFFTGFHPEYHRPEDDAERLNIPGMRRITQLLMELLERLDRSPHRPHPAAAEQPFHLAEHSSINGVTAGDSTSGPPRLGVRLQETPNHRGVRILEVQPLGVAASAGLLPGDVLLRIADNDIGAVADLQRRLQQLRWGTTVTIEIQRGGILRQSDLIFPAGGRAAQSGVPTD